MEAPVESHRPVSYAEALRQMTLRYERLVHAMAILRQLDALDDPALDPDETAARVLDAIAMGLAAENCSLMMVDPTGTYLELQAACSPLEPEVSRFPRGAWNGWNFRVGEGVVGTVASSGKPACVDDVAQSKAFLHLAHSPIRIRSLLSYPLKVDSTVVGVLNLSHSRPAYFSSESASVLALVAERAARIFANQYLRERVRETDVHYQRVADEAGDAILVFDRTGRVLSANRAVGRLSGRSPEAFTKGDVAWADGIHPDDRGRFDAHLRALPGAEGPKTIDYRYRDASGGLRHVEQHSATMSDASGTPVNFVSIVRDVSARKQIEEELTRHRDRLEELVAERNRELMAVNKALRDEVAQRKASERALAVRERRYRAIYDNSAFGILEFAVTGELLGVNGACARLFGFETPDAMTARVRTLADVVESPGFSWNSLAERVRTGREPARVELLCRRAGGGEFPAMFTVEAEVSPDGGEYLHGFLEDLSARKAAETERDRLAQVVEQAAETVIMTRLDGTIVYVNPFFETLTGYSRDEVVGQTPRLLKSGVHDATFYRAMWDTLLSGKVWAGRLINRRKDGTLIEEKGTISPVRDASGRVVNFVAVRRDVSAEAELENRLHQAQKMEAVGQLASGVAHDFNNLIQGVQGYTHLTLERLDDPEACRGHLQEVLRAAERATALTQQLLTFGRQRPLQPVDCNLNEVVNDTMKMLRRVIGDNIELEFAPASDLATVHADPSQLGQVLINLCVNARDAMPDGGRIHIRTYNRGAPDETVDDPELDAAPYVCCSVLDTGCGMAPDVAERAFEPFFTTKEQGKGTGLGLSTVYGIVRKHDGVVRVSSEPGKGTMFTFALPAVDRPAASLDARIEPAEAPRGTETILVAEDEDIVRRVLVQLLQRSGYRVIVGNDGAEALELFLRDPDAVDLAVLDVVMPRMSGVELSQQLRNRAPGLPILFTSGYSTGVFEPGFLEEIGASIIHKPYSPAELMRRIRDAIDARKEAHAN
jgi:PAS domain S-box-containing protein